MFPTVWSVLIEGHVAVAHSKDTKENVEAVVGKTTPVSPLSPQIKGKRRATAPSSSLPITRERARPTQAQNLTWLEEQSLREITKISLLFSVAKSLKVLSLASLSLAIYIGIYGFEGVLRVESFSQHVQLLIVRGVVAAGLFSLLYWEVYRQSIEMWVDGFTLRVSRGVFFKKRSVMPISPFLTVFIQQSPFEFLCRLYSCHMYTINSPSTDILTVPAMTRKNAFALKAYLTAQVNRLGKVSKEAADMEKAMIAAVKKV
jgi:membrane protein YdbS with pleckstrin-like domain